MNVALYDSSSNKIKTVSIPNTNQEQIFSYNLKAGIYYLEFEHFACTGNYNFTASLTNFAIKSVKIKSIKNGFIVKAKKSGTINGYEIRYSTNKKSWSIKSIATSSNLQKRLKG